MSTSAKSLFLCIVCGLCCTLNTYGHGAGLPVSATAEYSWDGTNWVLVDSFDYIYVGEADGDFEDGDGVDYDTLYMVDGPSPAGYDNQFIRNYDSLGLLTNEFSLVYNAVDSEFQNDSWESYAYDSAGRRTEQIIYRWSQQGDSFYVSSRIARVYDVNGNLLNDTTYVGLNFMFSGRTDLEYDSDGNLLRRRTYDFISGFWVLERYLENYFDTAGFQIGDSLWQVFSNDTFRYRRDFTLDAGGRPVRERQIRYSDNPVRHRLNISTFDFNRNRLSELQLDSSSATAGGWDSVQRISRTYNIVSGLLSESYEVYNAQDGWVPTQRLSFERNGFGQRTHRLWENWVDSAWQNDVQERYYYKPLSSSIDNPSERFAAKAWPNPFADELRFDLPQTAGQLLIYDLRGMPVETVNLPGGGKVELQTSDWPTGIYFWEWSDGLNRRSGKLLRD